MTKQKTWEELTRGQRREVREYMRMQVYDYRALDPLFVEALRAALRVLREPKGGRGDE